MRSVFCAAVAFCLFSGAAADAGFSEAALDAVSVDSRPNAELPLDAKFSDEDGRPVSLRQALRHSPAVLVFADYTCRTLCGPILAFAADGLQTSGLRPGTDFRLVVVGIDPKDGIEGARAVKESRIGAGTPLASAAVFLTGDAPAIRAITAAAGYHYAYDPEHDQFAHPAVAFVITSTGRVARVLSGLGLAGGDLRLALVEAGQGTVGGFADQLRLLCYGFDPARGIYTASIVQWLNVGGAATVLLIVGGVSFLTFRSRRRRWT